VLAHMAGESPRPGVVGAAWPEADQHGDLLALNYLWQL
jgi:hypothetical protein